jgi:hypothetical protein
MLVFLHQTFEHLDYFKWGCKDAHVMLGTHGSYL